MIPYSLRPFILGRFYALSRFPFSAEDKVVRYARVAVRWFSSNYLILSYALISDFSP